MKKEITIMVALEKLKLISVNALYKAGLIYRGNKPVPYIYKTADAKKFEAILDDQLRAIDWSEHMDWLRETKQFTVTQQYIFKTGINRRDVGNVEKLCSDGITRFIKNELGISGFDDSMFSDIHLYKSIIPGSQREYVCYKIAPSNFNMRFDKIEKPEQILFHFDGEPTWETKEFKKSFKELGLKYQLCTTDKKIKDHNTDVYFLDASDSDFMEKVIDLVDFMYSHKDSGFCYVGVLGNPKSEVIQKLNDLGRSNIKVVQILEHKDIVELFKDE